MTVVRALLAAASAALAVTLAVLATPALAQTYPVKPITIVVAYAPGASSDLIGRTVAEGLQAMWGQTVIIDNRAGAGAVVDDDGLAPHRLQPLGHGAADEIRRGAGRIGDDDGDGLDGIGLRERGGGKHSECDGERGGRGCEQGTNNGHHQSSREPTLTLATP